MASLGEVNHITEPALAGMSITLLKLDGDLKRGRGCEGWHAVVQGHERLGRSAGAALTMKGLAARSVFERGGDDRSGFGMTNFS